MLCSYSSSRTLSTSRHLFFKLPGSATNVVGSKPWGFSWNLATTSGSHDRTLCHTIATATLLKVPVDDWAIWPQVAAI